MGVRNIALIGMPGSGKTAVGRMAAERAGLRFVDTDQWIEERYGAIADLFIKGEPYFRDIETAVIAEAAGLYDTVIATGGGSVLKPENMENLKKQGKVAYIYRPLENILSDLADNSRPLLKGKRHMLGELYNQRKALYEKYADFTVFNEGSLDEAVSILSVWLRGEMK
jgi:shikimate kinase